MSLGPREKPPRRDRNEPELRAVAERLGWRVWTHLPCDWLVTWRGQLFAVEVKDGAAPPNRRRLTEAEVQFLEAAGEDGHVVGSVEELLALAGELTRGVR